MKTIVFALITLLICDSHAQTLKWTFPIPSPSFQFGSSARHSQRADILGNTAMSVDYGPVVFGNPSPGTQIVWVSAQGKLLYASSHPRAENLVSPVIISVSSTTLVVAFTRLGDEIQVVRKHTRRGTKVTFTDTELLDGEHIDTQGDQTNLSGGYFVIAHSPDQNFFLSLKRYSIR